MGANGPKNINPDTAINRIDCNGLHELLSSCQNTNDGSVHGRPARSESWKCWKHLLRRGIEAGSHATTHPTLWHKKCWLLLKASMATLKPAIMLCYWSLPIIAHLTPTQLLATVPSKTTKTAVTCGMQKLGPP